DCCYKLAAKLSILFSSYTSFETILVTPKSPSVSVPVLSKTTAFKPLAPSKLARLRISKPCLAEIEVETATTSGAAKPSACGQVITMTVTSRSRATSKEYHNASQMNKVINPEARAI